MLIVQISDSHISLGGPTDEERLASLRVCVDAINQLDPQPDLVMHTGDVVHNGTTEEYAAAAEILKDLRARFVVIPGNKDERQELMAAFPNCFVLESSDCYFHFTENADDTRIIFLDTKSEDSNKGTFCDARFAALKAELDNHGGPVVGVLHHPPFQVPTIPDPMQFEDKAIANHLLALFDDHHSKATLITGHVHRPFTDQYGATDVHILTAGAIDLRKGQDGDLQTVPLYALYQIARDGEVTAELKQVPLLQHAS